MAACSFVYEVKLLCTVYSFFSSFFPQNNLEGLKKELLYPATQNEISEIKLRCAVKLIIKKPSPQLGRTAYFDLFKLYVLE